jgi:hypothetical protein
MKSARAARGAGEHVIVVGIGRIGRDYGGSRALRQHCVARNELRNAEPRGRHPSRELASPDYVLELQQQDPARKELDASLQARAKQLRRSVVPEQAGDDGIAVKNQPHVLLEHGALPERP